MLFYGSGAPAAAMQKTCKLQNSPSFSSLVAISWEMDIENV